MSSASRLETRRGAVFLKYEEDAPEGFFAVEAAGLERLRAAGGPRVPAVLAQGESGGWTWLALEWLESGRMRGDAEEELGRGLAALHRSRSERWGAPADGFIGRLPQSNRWTNLWADFWWKERLRPQLERAGRVGPNGDWALLEERLPELLSAAESDGASVLHGDLWSGNVVWSDRGPALVDPASYHGHREVDLAMMELFGGFPERCFRAYVEAWPLQAGYDARKRVYQLYYLLAHINLFGASYVPGTLDTLRRVLEHA